MLYDGNGNLTRRENRDNNQVRQLIWDEENRLACTQENKQQYLPQTPESCVPGGSANEGIYIYNAAGTRVFKDSGQRSFAINQNYTEKGSNRFKHIFVGNQRLLTKKAESGTKLEDLNWYSHGDHLSSSSYITNASGQLQEYIGYFPFGEQWLREHPSQPVDYLFTGKEFDSETGYYYFGARYYDPRVSTWVSADNTFDGGQEISSSINLYMYVRGNPIAYMDPDGHTSILVTQPPEFKKNAQGQIQKSHYPHSAIAIEDPKQAGKFQVYSFYPAPFTESEEDFANDTPVQGIVEKSEKLYTREELKTQFKPRPSNPNKIIDLKTTPKQDQKMRDMAESIKAKANKLNSTYPYQGKSENCTDYAEDVIKASGKKNLIKALPPRDKNLVMPGGLHQRIEKAVSEGK